MVQFGLIATHSLLRTIKPMSFLPPARILGAKHKDFGRFQSSQKGPGYLSKAALKIMPFVKGLSCDFGGEGSCPKKP